MAIPMAFNTAKMSAPITSRGTNAYRKKTFIPDKNIFSSCGRVSSLLPCASSHQAARVCSPGSFHVARYHSVTSRVSGGQVNCSASFGECRGAVAVAMQAIGMASRTATTNRRTSCAEHPMAFFISSHFQNILQCILLAGVSLFVRLRQFRVICRVEARVSTIAADCRAETRGDRFSHPDERPFCRFRFDQSNVWRMLSC